MLTVKVKNPEGRVNEMPAVAFTFRPNVSNFHLIAMHQAESELEVSPKLNDKKKWPRTYEVTSNGESSAITIDAEIKLSLFIDNNTKL